MIDVVPPRIGIVGLGAIGGSLALALRRRPEFSISAWSLDVHDRGEAERAGIRVAASLDALARDIDLAVLAVPLDAIAELARTMLVQARSLTIVHTASLQRATAIGIDGESRARVVGAHPIAGTHTAGFAGARPDLFERAVVSVEPRLSPPLHDLVCEMWLAAGAARIEVRDAAAHDDLMAWVSHLPQLVATSLAATLAQHDIAPSAIGPGARDTTRLAQSSLDMWRPLLERAPPETRHALGALAQTIASLEHALESGTLAPLEQVWDRARRWRAAGEHV